MKNGIESPKFNLDKNENPTTFSSGFLKLMLITAVAAIGAYLISLLLDYFIL